MRREILSTLAAALMAAPLDASAETIAIGSFEKGLDGFSGAITADTSGGKDSAAAGKIENKDQKWVTVKKTLSHEKELVSVSFSARSGDVKSLAVRIVDSTGQNFQPRAQIKDNGKWQEIKVANFAAAGTIFGGADDKKIHHPVAQLQFILESTGTIWIDDVKLELADEILPEMAEKKKILDQAKAFPIANFDKGADGFSEAMKTAAGEGRNGTACGSLTKTAGQKWVSAGKTFKDLKGDFLQVSYWVKSKDVKTLGVRFQDSSGQDFQQRLPLEPNGEWQQVKITQFNKGQSWGGADDKSWHAPAKSITLVLEQDGTVYIDDIEAKLK
ncbi:MAG TPA: hypothetical protein DET40_12965 [Lentisphaeria bacterium]|nr:MAG: hypothetical protein A2X45_19130 [Lentisphaerae bacterium GWF2_50_93]HCE44452.1 hypothetical protein [Lentisphaeria bacterium]